MTGELPPELLALVERERDAPGPTPAARRRVIARVEATLGLATVAAAATAATAATKAVTGSAAATATTGKAAAVTGKAAALGWQSIAAQLVATKVVIVVAATGSVVGAGALVKHAVEHHRQARVHHAAPLQPTRPAPATKTVAPPATQTVAPAATQTVAPAATETVAPRPRARPLAEEEALVAAARAALLRHDFDGAARALARHAHRFADGQLSEERDSLRVRVAAARGDHDQARALAAEFQRAHPGSLLWPAVRAAAE